MRVKDGRELRRIAFWTAVPLVLCVLAPDTVASGLVDTMPSLWASGTALSLTLLTAVITNQK